MMKMNFKLSASRTGAANAGHTNNHFGKTAIFLAVAVLGVLIFSQVSAQTEKSDFPGNRADSLKEKREETRAEIQNRFCERITELVSKMSQRFSENREKIKERRESRFNNWEEKTSERDAKIASFRTKRDMNLENHLDLIEKRAETGDQKEAAAEFEKGVKEAIEARRDAMDAAMEAFRKGVEELHQSRKDFVENEADDLIEAGKIALEKAKEDCASGKTPVAVRQSLRSSLQAGKNNFSSEKQNLEKTRTQMQSLIQTRNAAFEKAKSDFQAAMEKLRTELKKDFPDEDDETEDETESEE